MILCDPLRWYIDPRTLRRKQWAHMVATDGLAELHRFALDLGLKPQWFQNARHPHYDLRPRQWRLAQVAGAMLVSSRDLVRREAVPICARYPECERGSTMRLSPDMDIPGVAVCSRECFEILLLPAVLTNAAPPFTVAVDYYDASLLDAPVLDGRERRTG